MAKGKYSRKKRGTLQRAQEANPKVVFVEERKIAQEETDATAKHRKQTAEKEDKMWWKTLWEWIRSSSSFTDWCLTAFTLVLATASIYQFNVMGGQLDVMRKDQRPWLKLTFDNFVTQVGSPIGGNLHMVNSGKTPAKKLEGKFAIEKVKNGEQPRLDFGNTWVTFTGGALFPNDAQAQAINMQQTVYGPSGPFYEAASLSQTDWDDYVQGRIFFVAYGSISYFDFFRVQHWTKYCVFLSAPESPAIVVPRQFTAHNCTDYNDVDDN